MVVQSRALWALGAARALAAFQPALLRVVDDHAGAGRIRRVIEEAANVMDK
jgi:hypothetical protein